MARRALGWLWWRAWTRLVAGDAAALCVAGLALGDMCLRFTWQAWHLVIVTYTFVLRGRRGTWRHPPSFCVSGVALRVLGWLWWRASTGLVAGDAAALCVAGVALGDMCLRFTWHAWHLVTYTFVLRGTRGTWRHPPSFCVSGVALWVLGWLWWRAWTGLVAGYAASLCVAGVALCDMCLRFTWQTWHLVTYTFVSRGRRGT